MTQVERTTRGLRLSGFLDVRCVADVRSALHATLDATTGEVVVDVSDLDALDATGLAVVVAAHRRALGQGRRLVLDGVRPPLARLLAVTRLNRVLIVRRLPPDVTSSSAGSRSAGPSAA